MIKPTDTAMITATREEIEALARRINSHAPTLSEFDAFDLDDARALVDRFMRALPTDQPTIVARARTRYLQRGAPK